MKVPVGAFNQEKALVSRIANIFAKVLEALAFKSEEIIATLKWNWNGHHAPLPQD